MDCKSCHITCLGTHSQKWDEIQLSQKLLCQVRSFAATRKELLILLEDGSLYDVDCLGKDRSIELASDIVDLFTGGERIIILDKNRQVLELVKSQVQENKDKIPHPLSEARKVVQVACGKSHMLILTKYGEIYGKGDNSQGQLGLGKKTITSGQDMKPIESLKGLPISQIAAGDRSSFCVTVSGRVIVWGQNDCGQLGLGDSKATFTTPKLLKYFSEHPVALVLAGRNHTAILTKKGELFTFGDNSHGQLGNLDVSKNQSTPWRVEELKDSEVAQVSCGCNHTVAYVPGCRRIFGFGDNSQGQLDASDCRKIIPDPIMMNGPWRVTDGIETKEIHAAEDSTLVLCGQSDESGEVCDRVIPVHRRIAVIDENLCEEIEENSGSSSDYDQVLNEIEYIFSSPSCWNASFSVVGKPLTKDFLGIDFAMAYDTLSRLCKNADAQISGAIITSLRIVVKSLSKLPSHAEALRVCLLIPLLIKAILERSKEDVDFEQQEIPRECVEEVFLPFIETSFQPSLRRMVKELYKVCDQMYFTLVVGLCKDIIKQVLYGSLKSKIDHRLMQQPLEMLKLLFEINSDHEKVNYKEFYIESLDWQLLHQHHIDKKGIALFPLKWNFLDYPFLLDAKAKTMLLEIDSKVRLKNSFNVLILEADRNNLLGTLSVLERVRDIQRPVQVKFVGEAGLDYGALKKEFFMLMFEEILNPSYGLFDENETSNFLWFPRHKVDRLDFYEFIGKLCGMALYNSVIVNFNIPLALYKELLGEKPHFDDFKEIDPVMGNSLQQVRDFTEEDDMTVEEVFGLNFTTPDGTPLIEGGEDIPVTVENRGKYIEEYLEFFFHKSVQKELDAFRKGFFEACAKDVLKLFRPEELMEMVTGIEDYDWETLKGRTLYEPIICVSGGFDALHPVIKWFWEVLLSMSKEDKNKFLVFLTGSNKIPITGLHMRIKQRQECDDFLPVAEVCFNALHLHSYSSKQVLEEKLRMAMQCKGFHTM